MSNSQIFENLLNNFNGKKVHICGKNDKKLKEFDIILKDNLPKEIYEILSYQSKNSSFNSLIDRKKDLY